MFYRLRASSQVIAARSCPIFRSAAVWWVENSHHRLRFDSALLPQRFTNLLTSYHHTYSLGTVCFPFYNYQLPAQVTFPSTSAADARRCIVVADASNHTLRPGGRRRRRRRYAIITGWRRWGGGAHARATCCTAESDSGVITVPRASGGPRADSGVPRARLAAMTS